MVPDTIQYAMNSGSGTVDQPLSEATSVLVLARGSSDAERKGCAAFLTEQGVSESKAICVTVSESPDSRLSLWQQHLDDEMPEEAIIVDAGSELPANSQAAASGAFPSLTLDTLPATVEPIDIGATVSRYLGRLEQADAPLLLCLHSLTGLLESWERDRVIALVTALNRQCGEMDVSSHHHMDPEAHTEETIEMFRPLYDVVYEFLPDHGWTVTASKDADETPTFRDTVTPPGGVKNGDPEEPETIPIPYSFDQVLELISAPRRRSLLYHLKDRSESEVPLDDLVDRVYEREKAIPARATPRSRDEVGVSLAHNHLPRLDDLGILSYETAGNTVEYYPNPALESVIQYVERLELG